MFRFRVVASSSSGLNSLSTNPRKSVKGTVRLGHESGGWTEDCVKGTVCVCRFRVVASSSSGRIFIFIGNEP